MKYDYESFENPIDLKIWMNDNEKKIRPISIVYSRRADAWLWRYIIFYEIRSE